MISAGEVGVSFIVSDSATAVLRAIAGQFENLDRIIRQTKESMDSFKLPAGVAKQLENMNKQLLALPGSAEGAVGGISTAFTEIDASITETMGRVTALKGEMSTLGRIPRIPGVYGPTNMSGQGGARLPPGRGSGGEDGAHSPFHSSVHAGPIGARSGDGLFMGAAVAGFSIWESLKASAELEQVQMNLRGAGVSQPEIEKLTKFGYDIGKKYGMTARDVLQAINEIRNPLNTGATADLGVEDAMRHMPALAQAAVRLKAQGGEGGKDVAADLYSFVKSVEFRGAIGPESFDKAIKAMTDADVATGGIVTPRTFLQMSQMLKSALPGLSDKYLYEIMPELAQEFKGPQAGTAAASLYQQLIAGQMRTKGLNLLAGLDLALLWQIKSL
jgi:hypothetical protein